MPSLEQGSKVRTHVLDFGVTNIDGKDFFQDLKLFFPVELLVVEVFSIQDDGIVQDRLDLFFDFDVGLHLVSIGNLPSDAYFLDELVFIFFGFLSGSNFPVEMTYVCICMFVIIYIFIFYIEINDQNI
jgi:hypothetical protein